MNDAKNRTAFLEVSELASSVIDIFKNSKAKYQVAVAYGDDPVQVLKDEEVIMAKSVFAVERSLIAKSKKDHYVKSGELKNTIYWVLGIIAALYLLSKI